MDLHARDLRQDVRELGELLGEVIEHQTTAAEYELVESVRRAAIGYREGELDSRERVEELLDGCDRADLAVVARAFATYFALSNLAEERERVRELRRSRQAGTPADSLAATVEDLAERGADPAEVGAVLDDVLIEPTFTAHPTEARRKTVKAKLRTVAKLLRDLDERRLTAAEAEAVEARLAAQVTTLWGTALIRDRRPDVVDEARNVQWYLQNVLYDVLPEVYAELERALAGADDARTDEEALAGAGDVDVPTLLRFRSWAGSDRDGNPYVTPAVTEAVLDRQRETVLERYEADLADLRGVLSQDGRQLAATDGLRDRIAALEDRLGPAAPDVAVQYPNEPYRQLVASMRASLARVTDVRPGGYDVADDLLADVEALEASLRANDAAGVAETYVAPLRRRVEAFGFVFAALDLRDHQQQHTAAVAEALARHDVDYVGMTEAERVDFLTEAVLQDDAVLDLAATDDLSADATRVLRRFDALADWQREYGPGAVDTYCISMCEEPSHVLEVLFLADQAGVVDLPTHAGLDVVPLLETEAALSDSRRIMGTLFENEAYAQALDRRDGVQEVMLGYSDSNKENGFLAAAWSLHRNQKRLARIADEYDVTLRLFHGRGGSISRGGGPMNDALLALPRETVTGAVKFTEQGEAIAEKYANPAVARRNLEQMLDAQIRARTDARRPGTEDHPEEWAAAMDVAAAAAREEYRDLLDTEGFVDFFEAATPIEVIENLNLGSRPASRSDERSVADLRAIPWVFSWTQARCILPGWYSLATGLSAYLDGGGDVETLREMYAAWPFFRTTVDNAALALARTDLEIAAEYAALADDDLESRFFPRIRREYDAACDLVRRVTGREALIDREWLRESLAHRNPYVDPLNLLQVRLLDADEASERAERVLRLTVEGIAAGMKNTG
jgi:phosphoenolpyruvate carboxylase